MEENKTMADAPVSPVTEDVANQNTNDKKDKMSKKQIIGLVVLSLIAVGGVLFGVYGMNSQNEQVAQLKAQATEAEEKIAKLEANTITITGPNGDTTEITNENAVNTADYIYVEEWGLKIKVPEELMVLRYKYNGGNADNSSSSLCVMGYNKKDDQSSPSFVDNDEYLTCISRIPKDSSPYGVKIFSEENYDYIFNNAQTYYSADENDISWEKESRELMSQVFGNSDNYSKI